MKIERVDDKTVKCFLSNEELEEYDIDYKDFVLRSEKAREVVKEIIEQAEEEVGYKPPQFAFDLQIMMLPEQAFFMPPPAADQPSSAGPASSPSATISAQTYGAPKQHRLLGPVILCSPSARSFSSAVRKVA